MTDSVHDNDLINQVKGSASSMAGELILAGFEGTRYSRKLGSWFKDLRPGGVILFSRNIENSRQTKTLISDLKKLCEDICGMPLFVAVDQEGGRVSRIPADFRHCALEDDIDIAKQWPDSFPTLRSLGADGSEELCESTHIHMASALAYLGFNIDYAPVLDIDTNPKSPVISDRSFGGDTSMVCQLGKAAIRGLKEGGMMTCAKHFPGHGDTNLDSHLDLPTDCREKGRLLEHELEPFRMAVDEGVEFIMTAHVLYPDLDPDYPATLSPRIIQDLLREKLCYDGVVVSDDLDMKAIAKTWSDRDMVGLCLAADIDQYLICLNATRMMNVRDTLKAMIDDGRLIENRALEKVGRLLRLKKLIG